MYSARGGRRDPTCFYDNHPVMGGSGGGGEKKERGFNTTSLGKL